VPDRGNRFAGDAWRNRLAAAIGTEEQYRTVALLQTLFGGYETWKGTGNWVCGLSET
jgi:hypothetical protein